MLFVNVLEDLEHLKWERVSEGNGVKATAARQVINKYFLCGSVILTRIFFFFLYI